MVQIDAGLLVKVLEIVCLENGDVVLVEAAGEAEGDADADSNAVNFDVVQAVQGQLKEQPEEPLDELEALDEQEEQPEDQPLVSIRFSPEVRDMLGDDVLGVAEAMIEAATAYISDEAGSTHGEFGLELAADRGGPDVDDIDDYISTAPVVLH